MLRFSSIVCGVDFSDHSAEALRCAAALATRHGSRLTAVTVLDPFLTEAAAVAADVDALLRDTNADLRAFVDDARAAGGPSAPVTLKVVIGRADVEILQVAQLTGADLIVLGTHGLGGIRKAFFGSTTSRVLNHTATSVLAVPLPSAPAGANAFEHVRVILAAVALDRDCAPIVEAARSLARDFGAALTLLHVLKPVQFPPRLHRHAESLDPVRRARAERRLADLAGAVGEGGARLVVASGEPAAEIARLAGPDGLIVVGLGFPRGLGPHPGSTAYRLVCTAHVPVLALPERGE